MTDYRSVETLEVFCQDERVGTLTKLPKGCEFRYEASFLAGSKPPIALHLPKTAEPLITEGILNLPTYFAGLLPEGVMFAAARSLIRSAKDDLFAILAATGRDAIGDVDVRVPGETDRKPSVLNLGEAKETIEAILSRAGGHVEVLSAIAGVQPKISLGGIVRASRGPRYIAKFSPPEFPGLAENELACMTLARKCGLRAPRSRIESGVYVIERFDRENLENGNIHKLHVEDMLQVMNLFPHRKYGLDFVEICQTMEQLGVSAAGILETMKLYAFSYIVGNGDLHAKNVSLIRRENGQWMPSPVYDIVSTLPYKETLLGADLMALALADEALGRFDLGDFVGFGVRFGIPERAVRNEITKIAGSVGRNATTLRSGLPDEVIQVVTSRAEGLAG